MENIAAQCIFFLSHSTRRSRDETSKLKKFDVDQCPRYQELGHPQRNCWVQPNCVKCADNHFRASCDKPSKESAKCANCGGQRPANFRRCNFLTINASKGALHRQEPPLKHDSTPTPKRPYKIQRTHRPPHRLKLVRHQAPRQAHPSMSEGNAHRGSIHLQGGHHLKSCLRDRVISFSSEETVNKMLTKESPQRSVLEPHLWNFLLDDYLDSLFQI